MPSNALDEELDKPCRACTDFRTWARRQTKTDKTSKNNGQVDEASNASNAAEEPRRADCPLDKTELGRATWGFLHTLAEAFPEQPTRKQQADMTHFLNIFAQFYPCEPCALDLQEDMKSNPVVASSRRRLSLWLCERHNTVNKKLGKPLFDCALTAQRWHDGWPDGSCD